MSCQVFVELVTDYFDGTMTGETRRRFEEHIEGCPGCSVYLEQIRETIRQVGRLAPQDLSPSAREALLDAFGHWRSS